MSDWANVRVPIGETRDGESELEGSRKNEEWENRSLNPLANLSPTKQMKSVKPAEPY